MRSLIACLKKECTDQIRTGKLMFLGILFTLFGIMNPAIAKLTPWLMEMMSESLAQSGMVITGVTVSAMDSWVQFFKNIPMALIAFVLLEGSIFTKEYQSGTLVLSLTKGLPRYQIVLAKSVTLVLLWTAGYWLCFAITCGYNAYFWDNTVAQNLMYSAGCWWLFGFWVIGLLVLFSAFAGSNSAVLMGTGITVLASYLLGFLPRLKEYMPTLLTDGNALIYGAADAEYYTASLLICAPLTLLCFSAAIPVFRRKQL